MLVRVVYGVVVVVVVVFVVSGMSPMLTSTISKVRLTIFNIHICIYFDLRSMELFGGSIGDHTERIRLRHNCFNRVIPS